MWIANPGEKRGWQEWGKDESNRISTKRKKITIMFKWFSFEWKLKKEEKHKKNPPWEERRKRWIESSARLARRKKSEKNIIESRNNFPTLKPNRTHLFFCVIYSSFVPHSPISAGYFMDERKNLPFSVSSKSFWYTEELTIISSVFLSPLFR